MADKKEEKKGEKKKKPSRKIHTLYEVSGDSLNRKNQFCPKCGPGSFLAKHQGRIVCGKCGYTEFEGKKKVEEEPVEEKVMEKEQVEETAVEADAADAEKLDIKATKEDVIQPLETDKAE